MLTEEIMYKALVEKDDSYEGLFFAAIKTTGIFCRPACTARKPLRENVAYYSSSREALLAGYRPCKICQPLSPKSQPPVYIEELIARLEADPSIKFRDYQLRQNGIDPVQVRRWFLKNHGITFHAYQRILKLNTAFKKIKEGEAMTSVAFDSGYESLSGFSDSFKNIFGVSPKNSVVKKTIMLTRIDSVIGPMIACATDDGICLLEFTERRMIETELKQLSEEYNATIVQGPSVHFEKLKEELALYFEGKLRDFSVPIKTNGTPFQELTWNALLKIPYGKTISYKELAAGIGKPAASRAVANANGKNRIALIIPCHRVINENGNLCGYGGGVWRKKWLLEMESGKKELRLF